MTELTRREFALAQLKMIANEYDIDLLKLFVAELEKSMEKNKPMKKALKKFEISIYPPKISVEFEFPYKKQDEKK